jgi:hypothetical protein
LRLAKISRKWAELNHRVEALMMPRKWCAGSRITVVAIFWVLDKCYFLPGKLYNEPELAGSTESKTKKALLT